MVDACREWRDVLIALRMDELSTPNWSVIGFFCLVGFVTAERLGALLEDPFTSTMFGLPMDHICAGISADLIGREHLDLTSQAVNMRAAFKGYGTAG